jgi:hypothetical protein
MATLSCRPRISGAAQSAQQRLVIRQDGKTAAFQDVPEVADGGHARQQLTVKGAPLHLSRIQFLRKET